MSKQQDELERVVRIPERKYQAICSVCGKEYLSNYTGVVQPLAYNCCAKKEK